MVNIDPTTARLRAIEKGLPDGAIVHHVRIHRLSDLQLGDVVATSGKRGVFVVRWDGETNQ